MSVLNNIVQSVKDNLPSKNILNNVDISLNNKNFKEAIHKKNTSVSLIAEVKRKSPSKGILNLETSLDKIIEIYDNQASAMSILTEPNYFGGSLEYLQLASQLTQKPLLRKDFIIDPIQIKEARYYGASAFLLIVASLSKQQLQDFILIGKEFKMDALVEIQNEHELEIILDIPEVEILGINNRNLHTLDIDMNTTNRIFKEIPKDKQTSLTIVSESGFSSKKDLEQLPNNVDAILMGTGFMQSKNPKKLLEEMFL